MVSKYEEDVDYIVDKLKLPPLSIQSVEDTYPGDISDLYKKNRRSELIAWRTCLYIYEIKNGSNLLRISEKYGITHATVINAIRRLKGFVEMNQKNNLHFTTFEFIASQHEEPLTLRRNGEDFCTKIALSQHRLQREITKRFGKLWT